MRHHFEDNQALLKALRRGENAAFAYLYQRYFRVVSAMVRRNSGDEEDAKEVFQETMIALFKKVRDQPDFQLTVEWSTFIYAVARNYWYSKLKKRSNRTEVAFEDTLVVEKTENPFDMADHEQAMEEKHIRVKTAFSSLKKECQDILDAAFYKKLSGSDIAKLLGYSEDFVKVKKFRCMEELRKRVLILNKNE